MAFINFKKGKNNSDHDSTTDKVGASNMEILSSPSNAEKSKPGGDGILYFEGQKFIQGITANQAKYVQSKIDASTWNGSVSFTTNNNIIDRYKCIINGGQSPIVNYTLTFSGTNVKLYSDTKKIGVGFGHGDGNNPDITIVDGKTNYTQIDAAPYTTNVTTSTITKKTLTAILSSVKMTTTDSLLGIESSKKSLENKTITFNVVNPTLCFTSEYNVMAANVAQEVLKAGASNKYILTTNAKAYAGNKNSDGKPVGFEWQVNATKDEYLYLLIPENGTTNIGSAEAVGYTPLGAQDTTLFHQATLQIPFDTAGTINYTYHIWRSNGKLTKGLKKTLKFS